jgi:hypothetical protein
MGVLRQALIRPRRTEVRIFPSQQSLADGEAFFFISLRGVKTEPWQLSFANDEISFLFHAKVLRIAKTEPWRLLYSIFAALRGI